MDLVESFKRADAIAGNKLKTVPISSLDKLDKQLKQDRIVGIDFEWDGATNSRPHSVGIATFDHAVGLEIDKMVLDYLRDIFGNPDYQVIGHNVVVDVVKAMEILGTPIRCEFLDTIILQRELAEHLYSKNNFAGLHRSSLEYFAYYQLLTEQFKHSSDPEFFSKPSKELCYRTAGDAWTGVKLAEWFYDNFTEAWHEMETAMDIDMGMILPVAEMVYKGIQVDTEVLEEVQQEIRGYQGEYAQQIIDEYNIDNPNSPKQLLEAFNNAGVSITSTAVDKLSELTHPLAQLVLNYRKWQKLYSTYTNKLPSKLDDNNTFHPNLAICGTNTGRMSSKLIMLIPKSIRRVFKSVFGDDGVLAELDASQSEFRCLGYLANSKPIIEAYEAGIDFHTKTAEDAGITRANAKTVNFAYIYGATYNKLVVTLVNSGLKPAQAKRTVKSYMNTMDKLGILDYQKQVYELASQRGYVKSPYGRRGYRLGWNNVVNFPIQSFSADLNKQRILYLYKAFKEEKLESRVWLELHDAAQLDIYKPEVSFVKEIIAELDNTIPDVLHLNINMQLPLDYKEFGSYWEY